MCEIISFLSGKGGVGKTSIAVNEAYFAAKCGLRVLLVDCDLNTNGATTFYELNSDLLQNATRYFTFRDFLQSLLDGRKFDVEKEGGEQSYIRFESGVDFIPAARNGEGRLWEWRGEDKLDAIRKLFYEAMEKWQKLYDVIILDHAAGYTDLIELTVPLSTKIFLVREADKLSLEATKKIYYKLCAVNRKIIVCVNKIPNSKYESVVDRNDNEDIIEYCTGFKYQRIFANAMEKGRVLEETQNFSEEQEEALERIAMVLLSEFKGDFLKYTNPKKELRSKEQCIRWVKKIKTYHIVVGLISAVFAMSICAIFEKGGEIFFVCFGIMILIFSMFGIFELVINDAMSYLKQFYFGIMKQGKLENNVCKKEENLE